MVEIKTINGGPNLRFTCSNIFRFHSYLFRMDVFFFFSLIFYRYLTTSLIETFEFENGSKTHSSQVHCGTNNNNTTGIVTSLCILMALRFPFHDLSGVFGLGLCAPIRFLRVYEAMLWCGNHENITNRTIKLTKIDDQTKLKTNMNYWRIVFVQLINDQFASHFSSCS